MIQKLDFLSRIIKQSNAGHFHPRTIDLKEIDIQNQSPCITTWKKKSFYMEEEELLFGHFEGVVMPNNSTSLCLKCYLTDF
jgi:hypothetical protein